MEVEDSTKVLEGMHNILERAFNQQQYGLLYRQFLKCLTVIRHKQPDDVNEFIYAEMLSR